MPRICLSPGLLISELTLQTNTLNTDDHWQNCVNSRSSDDTVAQRFDERSAIIRLKCARLGGWRTLHADLSGLLGHISSENVLRRQYASSEMLVRLFKSSGNPPPRTLFRLAGERVWLSKADNPTFTLTWRGYWPAVRRLDRSQGLKLSQLSLFFIFHVTFHVDNQVQQYECFPWESDWECAPVTITAANLHLQTSPKPLLFKHNLTFVSPHCVTLLSCYLYEAEEQLITPTLQLNLSHHLTSTAMATIDSFFLAPLSHTWSLIACSLPSSMTHLWLWDELTECVVGQFLFGFMTLPIWPRLSRPPASWLRRAALTQSSMSHRCVGCPASPKRQQIGPQTVWRAMLVGSSVAVLPSAVPPWEVENAITATLILRW